MEINHIGIAVKSVEESGKKYREILEETGEEEIVEKEGVRVVIFKHAKIELREPLNETSSIAKFIEKRGEGLNHIAFSVENIERRMEELKSLGFFFTKENPTLGAKGTKVAFIHPKSANGVLIELVEEV